MIAPRLSYDALVADLAPFVAGSALSFGMLVLESRPEHVLPLVTRLSGVYKFSLFLDVTAVDYPGRAPRFEVVYHFYSRLYNTRIRIKVPVAEERPTVPTLTGLYGSARFMEREVHEMYGIVFSGNDDLRPLLLYEGFVGHPLRKDYSIDAEQPLVTYRN